MQKYRADYAGEAQMNGAIPWYTRWMGGPTLVKIAQCPVENRDIPARMVYITGEPDTWFSAPAVTKYRGVRIKGYVTTTDDCYVFRALDGQGEQWRLAR